VTIIITHNLEDDTETENWLQN